MSPKILPVTITSNCAGSRTICIAALSTYIWLNSTSENSSACSAVTSSRHNTLVSSTLALSTEQTLFLRVRASSKAARAVGDFFDAASLAKIDAAGEFADDDEIDVLQHPRLQRRRFRQRRIGPD